MIISWVLYGLLTGTLVAGAAFAGERALRLLMLPARGVWAGALLLIILLMAVAPFRADLPGTQLPTEAAGVGALSLDYLDIGTGSGSFRWLVAAQEALDEALHTTLSSAAALAPDAFDRVFLGVWLFLTASLALLTVWTYLRAGRRLSGLPIHEVDGARIRISRSAGPALVGLLRPEVVVPRWFLDLEMDQQRLVLAHEEEHLRGGDAWLLFIATCGVVLLPWHPAAHWMRARLRLATELDCDARVLRRDVSPRAYGSLLIDLAARGMGSRPGAPALTLGSSHLQRRILAMKRSTPRFAAPRGIGLTALACLGLLAACEAEVPTAAQIEEMDVATAEAQAQRIFRLNSIEPNAVYTVDGVQVEAAEAHGLAPESIAQIEVVRRIDRDDEAVARVSITTREAAGVEGGAIGPVAVERVRVAGPELADSEAQPLVLIDGQPADAGALRDLSPDRIESIEVIKGPAAARYSELPGAENGVIRVTTKRVQTPSG